MFILFQFYIIYCLSLITIKHTENCSDVEKKLSKITISGNTCEEVTKENVVYEPIQNRSYVHIVLRQFFFCTVWNVCLNLWASGFGLLCVHVFNLKNKIIVHNRIK